MEEQEKPEVLEFIKESSEKKKAAFGSSGEDIISSSFSHPRDLHYITSPFWSRRVYMRYKEENGKRIRLKNKVRVHRGLDLRGVEGAPLFALADGRVVLADMLYYEGNMLILDHGNGIFSYYMHLNSIRVKKGDTVHGGELWQRWLQCDFSPPRSACALMIRGVLVDPHIFCLCL